MKRTALATAFFLALPLTANARPFVPPPPLCGNGVLDQGEECDDGNFADGDGCSMFCFLEPDAGVDGGSGDTGNDVDGGNDHDGGNAPDGGGARDTGGDHDSGRPEDSGPPDAGNPPRDSGPPDTGALDGGARDSGTSPTDAGATDTGRIDSRNDLDQLDDEGCGCNMSEPSGGVSALALLGLAFTFIRRRR